MNTPSTQTLPTRLTLTSSVWSRFGATLAMMTALFLLALSAQAADVLQLAPSYKAVGKNGDGSSYTGTVTIKIISDTTFGIEWKIGGSVTKGFGMRMNDTLSATYMLDGQPGLIIYKVQGDGTLAGIWAIKGQPGNGSEVLTAR
ncbi:MAG TPA: hypothetical protein VK961_21770 [Chthoniobacter sp.]|nr:hypothetical protein [Chthoniobacter sp.]